jgi:HEPN domain-containing protein
MNDIVKAWLSSAEMDLENIRVIIDNEFLTPVSCFHAQQCVEKSFKAMLEHHAIRIPKTHDLLRLYNPVDEFISKEVDMKLLQKLNDVYVDTRYPGDLGLMPDGKPTVEEARQFYDFALSI